MGTRTVTNQAAGTSYEQTTLPFGTALNAESSGSQSKRFTSYEPSQRTGLDYAVNRTYDSKQGRFTQVDPIEMSAVSLGSPQTLNLYTYCGNDPINHLDPNGLFWGSFFKWIGKIFKVILIAVAVLIAVAAIVALNTTGFGASVAWKLALLSASIFASVLAPPKIGAVIGIATGLIISGPGIIINFASTAVSKLQTWQKLLAASNFAGAISNSFAQRKGKGNERQRRIDITTAVYKNALWRLQKKPGCASLIKGNSSYDPANILQTISLQYGGSGPAVADVAGEIGSSATIFLNDPFFDKGGDVGGWKTRSTMNTINARTMVLLHELRHALTGVSHPDTGNPTVDEADPNSNTNWNKAIAKECFGVTFN